LQKKKAKKKKQNSETLNPLPVITLRKQEGSCTTRCQLQTCLGDADKQDWMLKE
jgi:hypothetical protein